jgi:hypothetical protein
MDDLWPVGLTALSQIFPTVLFPTLNSLAILCTSRLRFALLSHEWVLISTYLGMVDNQNSVLTNLGSGFQGFGFLDLSFDWNSIASVVSLGVFFKLWYH